MSEVCGPIPKYLLKIKRKYMRYNKVRDPEGLGNIITELICSAFEKEKENNDNDKERDITKSRLKRNKESKKKKKYIPYSA